MNTNLTSANAATLNPETELGWLNMPEFGAGYLEFISRDLIHDEFEPAAELSDQTNDFLAALPIEARTAGQPGWHEVSERVGSLLRESFWSAIASAIDLREGDRVAA